jgi:DNA-directed RNA polymerase specialized sigma subunit
MTTLTMRDEKRIEIIQRVFRGELTVLRAAVILGISERHFYRIQRLCQTVKKVIVLP